jgi:phosphoribosylamine--glycine ligase
MNLSPMTILLVGSGGREHALAWKIAQSPLCKRLVCAPGNPGIAQICETWDVGVTEIPQLLSLAQEIDADLVVVGPESALEAELGDWLDALGIPCFGPIAAAAQLETSKAFTKTFCDRHGLPTAAYGVFEDSSLAKAYLSQFDAPYVIKADGLAAGKGVVIAESKAEAEAAIDDMLGGRFGAAGSRVVIEEFMRGEEASLFALCDGQTAMLFGAAQDHKRAFDGDQGPNTGGMGTYSPPPVLTDALIEESFAKMISPAVAGMAVEGMPYRGVLYAGLMLTEHGPRLVEFNARFGDPECQVLMLRLKSDLVPLLYAAATGRLDQAPVPEWHNEAAICVVLAAKGYPDSPQKGSIIRGAEQDFGEGVELFHAGTVRDAEGLKASGGRVLNVCARGASLAEARERAYAAVDAIDWPGGFHRRDIGWRALD